MFEHLSIGVHIPTYLVSTYLGFFCFLPQRALRNKFFRKNETYKKDCWLNYADDEYSQQQISDIRAVLNVLYLFIPVPLFWALFDQQVYLEIIRFHE